MKMEAIEEVFEQGFEEDNLYVKGGLRFNA